MQPDDDHVWSKHVAYWKTNIVFSKCNCVML